MDPNNPVVRLWIVRGGISNVRARLDG